MLPSARYFVLSTDKVSFNGVSFSTANLGALSVHFRAKFDVDAISTVAGTALNLVSVWGTDASKTIFQVVKDGPSLVVRAQYGSWVTTCQASDMGLSPGGTPDTGWHSYLWTWSTADQAGKIYRDGVLLTTVGSGNVGYLQPASTYPLVIGGSALQGVALSDVGIWASKITAMDALNLASTTTSADIPAALGASLPLTGIDPETCTAGKMAGLTATTVGTTVVSGPDAQVTTAELVSSLNPALLGRPVILMVTVRGGTPSGNVLFSDASNNILATVALSNGVASLMTSVLPLGTIQIKATYVGAVGYSPCVSNVVSQVVTNADTTGMWKRVRS